MSNETKSDQKPAGPPQPQPTRRPLRHLWFAHPYDLPGTQVTSLGAGQGLMTEAPPESNEKAAQPRHFLAWHVPALGVVQLQWNPGGQGGTKPTTYEIPVAMLLKWEVA